MTRTMWYAEREFPEVLILRNLVSILLLPSVVVIVVPRWITGGIIHSAWPNAASAVLGRASGGILFVAGFLLFVWCVILFGKRGRGTLAPWDPPKHFVASGPYLYTRNPMITGVLAMVTGQALFHGSWPIGQWALTFLVINQIYFVLFEEPQLERRFGEEYRRYKREVPRWIPRFSPWTREQ